MADSLTEITINESYKNALRQASNIMKSRPMNARQLAGYWTDHVIKFGASHLRSKAFDVSLYNYLMIDIILYIFLFLFVVCVSICGILLFAIYKNVTFFVAVYNILKFVKLKIKTD